MSVTKPLYFDNCTGFPSMSFASKPKIVVAGGAAFAILAPYKIPTEVSEKPAYFTRCAAEHRPCPQTSSCLLINRSMNYFRSMTGTRACCVTLRIFEMSDDVLTVHAQSKENSKSWTGWLDGDWTSDESWELRNFGLATHIRKQWVLAIMPNRPLRDQWEYLRNMERHFLIKLELSSVWIFFLPNSLIRAKKRFVKNGTTKFGWNIPNEICGLPPGVIPNIPVRRNWNGPFYLNSNRNFRNLWHNGSTQWVLFPLHPQYFPLQPFCVTSNKPAAMETTRCHCHVLINITKKNSIAIFLSPVLTYQKREISLSVGCKNRRLGMIVMSFQDFRLSDIFLFSNKQCTFVPFGEFISSQ